MAKPSLSQTSSQSFSVTESPNHWCAISCATSERRAAGDGILRRRRWRWRAPCHRHGRAVFDAGELLIRIRSDAFAEEFDGLAHGCRRRWRCRSRGPVGRPSVSSGTPPAEPKWRETNCATAMLFSQVAMGTDCFQCVMRRPSRGRSLHQQTVGDHLVAGGRGDEEFAGGLVVGVVDGGEPLVREVGPVLTEKTSVAVFVLDEFEAAGGHAVVGDVEQAGFAGLGRCGKGDHQAVGMVGVFQRAAIGSDGGHGHALSEVEGDFGDAIFDKADGGGGFGGDFVIVVGEGDAEHVVLHVEIGLAGVVICSGRQYGPSRKRNGHAHHVPRSHSDNIASTGCEPLRHRWLRGAPMSRRLSGVRPR